MALGARTSDLLGMVMSQSLWMTATGIAGTAIALGGTGALDYLLYKVSLRDPLALGSAFLVMMFASPRSVFPPRLAGNAHRPGARLKE